MPRKLVVVAHDVYRSWAIRARLEREHGTFANQVIWFGETPLIGDPSYANEGFLAMDRWLTAVERDQGTGTLAEKIRRDRPSDVNDRCSNIDGVQQVDAPGIGPVCELPDVQTRYGTPHTVAGESVATDSNKCALKPLRRLDYYPITFTDSQWQQLKAAFPTGVCDWTKPGKTSWARTPGRPTRTAAATSSTAVSRSVPHRPARAVAGRVTRSAPGSADARLKGEVRRAGSRRGGFRPRLSSVNLPPMTHDVAGTESELREAAIRSLRKKRDFRTHLLAYFLVNGMLIVIWAVTGADFFWPVFPLAGWGIALAFNAWDVYGRGPITEEDIQREQNRLRRS